MEINQTTLSESYKAAKPLQILCQLCLCEWAVDMSTVDMNGSLVIYINISFVNPHVWFLYKLGQRGADSVPDKHIFVDILQTKLQYVVQFVHI